MVDGSCWPAEDVIEAGQGTTLWQLHLRIWRLMARRKDDTTAGMGTNVGVKRIKGGGHRAKGGRRVRIMVYLKKK